MAARSNVMFRKYDLVLSADLYVLLSLCYFQCLYKLFRLMVCIMHFTYTYTFPTAESAYFSQVSFDLPS